MEKLYYPAIFHPESTGFSVTVPDLEGCISQGENLNEALEMIEDAIGLYLDDIPITECPAPSAPDKIRTKGKDFMMVIAFDRYSYMRKHDTKAVKKTLSLPAWLNYAAEEAHLNFSGVLQAGLKQQLGIK